MMDLAVTLLVSIQRSSGFVLVFNVPVIRAAVQRGAEEEVPDEILGPEVLRVDRRLGGGRRTDGLCLVRLGQLVQLVFGKELLEAGMKRGTDLLLKCCMASEIDSFCNWIYKKYCRYL